MSFYNLLLIGAGIALLWMAADHFVVAATRLARIWRASPVLIGALVVGFGTSAPELTVSAVAALRGELAESVGNVVGSNAANLSLVLGMSAMLAPVANQARLIRREGLATLVAMAVLTWAVWDDLLGRGEGWLLLAGMAAAIVLLFWWSGRDFRAGIAQPAVEGLSEEEAGRRLGGELFRAAWSLGGIVAGSWLLVEGGDRTAQALGLTGGFVGATIFALGTSLPELATTLAAARRRANALVLGNLLGSNLFNSLLVMGVAGVIGPGAIGERRLAEYAVMMAIGGLVIVLGVLRPRLGRPEGAALLASFVIFIAVVAQNATV